MPSLIVLLAFLAFCSASFPTYTPETFPDSLSSPALCGMLGVSLICDPNSILSADNGGKLAANHLLLEKSVENVTTSTRCACGPMDTNLGMCRGERGFTISVALVDKMQLNPDEHTRVAVMDAAKRFADVLRVKQNRGQCDDDVNIFFSKQDHVMWTSVGKVSERYLTVELINSITINAEDYFRAGDYTKGLNYTISLFGQVLRGEKVDLAPPSGWYWPIPLWAVIAIGVGLLLLALACCGLAIWGCCLCCECCHKHQRYEMGQRM